MNGREDSWPPPHVTLSIAVGIVGCVWALVWGLPRILHAFCDLIVAVIQVSKSGVLSPVAIASWVMPTASAGLAAAGAGTVIVVLVKAAKEATEQPVEWTVPILGLIGSLFLDLSKEFGIENGFIKAAFTAATAFLVVVAGACWKKRDWLWRSVSVLLILAPPFAVLVRNIDPHKASSAFNDVPWVIWVRLGGFVLMGVLIAFLYRWSQRNRI